VDLAAGCDRVVVLAPITTGLRRSVRPSAQLAALAPDTRSILVTPDGGARQAIGRNVLDPARRAGSARAGWAQAAAIAPAVRAVWGDTTTWLRT
jgi:NTE family protein